MKEDFFEEQLPGSKVKSEIVSSYFRQWANVIMPSAKRNASKIGYLDFFSGQGKYDDGSDSTPLLILKSALSNDGVRDMLVSFFNDKEKSNVEKLEEEIKKIPNIDKLKYKPVINNVSIGGEVVEQLKKVHLIPSLVFIDPFGYKGLSLEFIGGAIKDWGCDCIFFFNYNRINAAINNPFMVENVNAIFGKSNADFLRTNTKNLFPNAREPLVLNTFFQSLKEVKGTFSLKFKFYKKNSNKTSHFLIFVTKHSLGYKIMKETMARNCIHSYGIPTYEFHSGNAAVQLDIFNNNPIGALANDLSSDFSGKQLSVEDIYDNHNIGKPYIKSNYKAALLKLEGDNKIICNPTSNNRRVILGNLTMGDKVIITFK